MPAGVLQRDTSKSYGDNERPPTSRSTVDDQLLRTTGIALLMGVGVLHFVQIVDTLNQTPWLGAAFLALIVGSLVAGVLLSRPDSRPGWILSVVVAGAAIAGYVFTRLVGTSFDNGDVGNWAENLGLASLFVESILLVVGAYGLFIRPPSKLRRR